jgi:hypothetical protein
VSSAATSSHRFVSAVNRSTSDSGEPFIVNRAKLPI